MSRNFLGLGCLLAVAAAPGPAHAGPYGDELGRCAIAATTAADRTALLRWSFLIAATNPALADLAPTSPEIRARSARAVAVVFNRIMLRDCRRHSVEALRREGLEGVQLGFQALGLLAGQEMMTNDATMTALEELATLLDQEGLAEVVAEAGAQPPI